MSGGHYDYLYQKLEDLASRLDTSRHDNMHYTRVKTSKILSKLAEICQEIEWIDSGDSSFDEEFFKKKFDELRVLV